MRIVAVVALATAMLAGTGNSLATKGAHGLEGVDAHFDLCNIDPDCEYFWFGTEDFKDAVDDKFETNAQRLRKGLQLLAVEMRTSLTIIAAIALTVLLGGAAFGASLPIAKMSSVLIAVLVATASGALVGYLIDEEGRDITASDVELIELINTEG